MIHLCTLLLSLPWSCDEEQPNFVWLISEDNSVHYLDLFFEGGAPTPRIAELASGGLRFKHAFSNGAVCSVARTTLMTGCYGPRIGTQYHRKTKPVPMPEGLRMFPAYLRDQGYYTTNRQKKDYNAVEGKGVWDESSRKATWRNRSEGQPFFHMQSFAMTHESSLHFPEADIEGKPTKTDPSSITVAPYHPDTPTFRYTVARYHDRIQQVDQQIGAVVDQLRDDGLLESTFIFYFGDHGGVLPGSKGYAYERGLHVPLVVRIPEKWKHIVDAKRGATIDGFVSFIDFGPTLLHLAGVPVPKGVDGRPFLGPEVTADKLGSRDEAIGYADRFDEKYDLVRTLRKGRFEYVRSYQPFLFDGLQNNYRYRMAAFREWRSRFEAGELNEVQKAFFSTRPPELLFDIEEDPYETANLAADPAYANILLELRSRMQEILRGWPDLSFFPESVLIEEGLSNPTKFGQDHQTRVARLIATADLALSSWSTARTDLLEAAQADDPWIRYWAFIALTTHGVADPTARELATTVAQEDDTPLVRLRALEYLATTGSTGLEPALAQTLRSAPTGVQAGLMLNSITWLRDGPLALTVPLTSDLFIEAIRKNDVVKRRLEYLR